MNEEINERAYARAARVSWIFASRGARRHVESARSWVRAEGLEARIKEDDARAVELQNARAVKAHARKPKRARATSVPERAYPMSAHQIKARAFQKRAFRTGVTLIAPCALIAYPVASLIGGDLLPIALWPAAYGYLVWDGWAHRKAESVDESDSSEGLTNPAVVNQFQRMEQHTPSLQPNAEEVHLITRLGDWGDLAAERKMSEVLPEHPIIDESGLLIPVSLTGRWTKGQLDTQLDQVRALLAVPDGIPTQVKLGGTANRAYIRIRTRTRELDLAWNPERKGLGLDADTAEVVSVDLTDRILVAGMSGAGKSVVLRVLMASALAMKHTTLAIIDVKVEGALWSHTARVERKPDGIQALVLELLEEMQEREDIMCANGQDLWEPTDERPRIIVVIDEGAEFMGWVPEAVDGVRTLAVRGRSSQIVLWWATQKPTLTGQGKGLDTMISGQFMAQICLAVNSPTEARNVLGENATADGWHPESLLKGGWALAKTQGSRAEPNPIRVWFMTKEHVKALAPREPWGRGVTVTNLEGPTILDVALQLSSGSQGVPTAVLSEALGITDVEVHARMRAYGVQPEPNAFAMGDGNKARGYRRVVLEDAKRRQKEDQ